MPNRNMMGPHGNMMQTGGGPPPPNMIGGPNPHGGMMSPQQPPPPGSNMMPPMGHHGPHAMGPPPPGMMGPPQGMMPPPSTPQNSGGGGGPPNPGGKVFPPNQPMIFNPQNPNAPPIHICGVCHHEVQGDFEEALMCESGCCFWYHRTCVGLSPEAYHFLKNEILAEWVCENCYLSKRVPTVKHKS